MIPNTAYGRDIVALADRGDLGASIGFRKAGTKIARGVDPDGTKWQVLKQIDLVEISLTANPAYRGTTANVIRSEPEVSVYGYDQSGQRVEIKTGGDKKRLEMKRWLASLDC